MTPASPLDNIRSCDDARRWREQQRGRVVFTNGVFDLLHPGHVDVLVGARACGDVLVVGINSDASVQRLKGPERPIRSAAIAPTSWRRWRWWTASRVFDQDTPLELVQLLQPDVIVKGGDYDPSTVVGRRRDACPRR